MCWKNKGGEGVRKVAYLGAVHGVHATPAAMHLCAIWGVPGQYINCVALRSPNTGDTGSVLSTVMHGYGGYWFSILNAYT